MVCATATSTLCDTVRAAAAAKAGCIRHVPTDNEGEDEQPVVLDNIPNTTNHNQSYQRTFTFGTIMPTNLFC